jgi:hypothetical protein
MDLSSENRNLLWHHWIVLAGGCFAGLVAVALVSGIPFDFSRELAEAKRLGIVSLTILNGYPKSRDLLNYALLVLLPVSCSLGGWLVWSRDRRRQLALLLADSDSDMPPGRRFILALSLLFLCLLLKFNINNFYGPSGGWGFLGEEGQFLADIQILLNGGDYARDFFSLYGPLVVYPLGWTMKLFGASVLVGRVYSYLLSLAAAVILIAVLNCSIKNRTLFIVAVLTMGALFVSGGGRTSGTMLRVMLGFVPLLIMFLHQEAEQRLPALGAGFMLGVSLLFSQEVGLCAGIAMVSYLVLDACGTKEYGRLVRRLAWLTVGCSLVVLPLLAHFYRQNSLGLFFESLYGYPKVVTLGYGSLPFPSFMHFVSAPLAGGAYLPYWMIATYIVSAILSLVLLFLGVRSRDIHFRIGLLVFGLFLFRAALGRSDDSHYFFTLPPALLLMFLLLDDMVGGAGPGRGQRYPFPLVGRLSAGAMVVSLLLLFASSRVLRENMVEMVNGVRQFTTKFMVNKDAGIALSRLSRSGEILYDPVTAEDMTKIGRALDRYTKPGDYVLFFPNEAAYYFLFDRRVPTRYVHAYFAATTAQRLDMIADLERTKPVYVVYSLDTWRIDNIPEEVQVPEIVGYLKQKYALVEDVGSILVLKRKDGSPR